MVVRKLLRLDEMEPIAREATRRALNEYQEPPKSEQADWTLGRFETETEGVFEIYIPSEKPLDAKIISCARVDRRTGEVTVTIFLDKKLSRN